MILRIHERVRIDRPRTAVYDHTNRADAMTSFTGYGPIPGIREARYLEAAGPRLGARREVLNTDGSKHLEEIVVFEPPRRHDSRITGLTGPFGLLVRECGDDWVFTDRDDATQIERTFTVTLRTPWVAPLALPLIPLLRRAVRRNLINLKRELERSDGEPA